MKAIWFLFYVAMMGLVISATGFLMMQFGFKPLIGSYTPSYEDIVASGVISIAASCLMIAIASMDTLEKSLKK